MTREHFQHAFPRFWYHRSKIPRQVPKGSERTKISHSVFNGTKRSRARMNWNSPRSPWQKKKRGNQKEFKAKRLKYLLAKINGLSSVVCKISISYVSCFRNGHTCTPHTHTHIGAYIHTYANTHVSNLNFYSSYTSRYIARFYIGNSTFSATRRRRERVYLFFSFFIHLSDR